MAVRRRNPGARVSAEEQLPKSPIYPRKATPEGARQVTKNPLSACQHDEYSTRPEIVPENG